MLLPKVERHTIIAMNDAPQPPTSAVIARSAIRTSPRIPGMSSVKRYPRFTAR